MSKLKAHFDASQREIDRLKQRLSDLTEQNGMIVDGDLHSDLQSIVNENNQDIRKLHPEGTFKRLFWEQQVAALEQKDAHTMKWHPMMIRWCLHLKLISTAAYSSLRSSGLLKLPSERTLRDYTHFVKSLPGFQDDIDQLLVEEVKQASRTQNESNKFMALLLDEVKIKEGIVYDKHSVKILGFVDLGELNNCLRDFEQQCKGEYLPDVAKGMLVLMVVGVFIPLEFPYAQFPVKTITGESLFPIVWEAIRRLETIGLNVISTTCDGAKFNRKFFRLHDPTSALVYKTRNPFSSGESRFMYFIADVPHLLKTVRNCWSNSGSHSKTRELWVSATCTVSKLMLHSFLPLRMIVVVVHCWHLVYLGPTDCHVSIIFRPFLPSLVCAQ